MHPAPSTVLPILYRDEHLIAVSKPSGMFVHRTDEDRSDEHVVVQLIRDQIGKFVYPIHRLDRATSGIVLFALSGDAAARMSKAFSERLVSKTYWALVRGFSPSAGSVSTPLVPSRGRGKPAGHPHAVPQDAETRFRTLQQFELPIRNDQHETTRCSLVEVEPLTGRYHQIRRHFNYESHPVIGDTSHGDTRHNTIYQKCFGLDRLMLAAVKLEFQHPYAGGSVVVANRPDHSFSGIIGQLQSYAVDIPLV